MLARACVRAPVARPVALTASAAPRAAPRPQARSLSTASAARAPARPAAPRAYYSHAPRVEKLSAPAPAVPYLEASFGVAGAALLLGAAAYVLSDDDKAEAAESFTGNFGSAEERTFIAIKPDGVQRGLIGEIVARFEKKGYKLVAVKVIQPTEGFAKKHYEDLAQKPFFPSLVKYFSSGPVFAMVWEGKNVIVNGRKIIGATNPAQAEPGSIRGDLCIETGRNIIHGSDSKEAAAAEIALWFRKDDFADYKLANAPWIGEGK